MSSQLVVVIVIVYTNVSQPFFANVVTFCCCLIYVKLAFILFVSYYILFYAYLYSNPVLLSHLCIGTVAQQFPSG